MPRLPVRPLLAATTLAVVVAAPPAHGQRRDPRDARAEVELRETRERLARERAVRARREAELRREVARAGATRVVGETRGRDGWRDDGRPRVTLGGGLDLRSFGDDPRYLVQAGVDFRSRSGLGVRPEVLVGWSDAQQTLGPVDACPTCLSLPTREPLRVGRSRMVGVAITGSYTLLRGSPVRPYLLSGLGVFTTRAPEPVVAIVDPGRGPIGTPPDLRAGSRFRNGVDVGLTAGAGLEFDLGPVRLFTEYRYLLTDQPRPLGFSGMTPLTVGLRL